MNECYDPHGWVADVFGLRIGTHACVTRVDFFSCELLRKHTHSIFNAVLRSVMANEVCH